MTTSKKMPVSQDTAYNLAAAARRAKFASVDAPIEGEIKPIQGRIRIKLSGSISQEALSRLCGPSAIDIPEFAAFKKQYLK